MYLQEVFRVKRRKKLSVGVLALSVTFGDSSPRGGATGVPVRLAQNEKGPLFSKRQRLAVTGSSSQTKRIV